jgi:hypothetical protein
MNAGSLAYPAARFFCVVFFFGVVFRWRFGGAGAAAIGSAISSYAASVSGSGVAAP